MSGSFSPDVLNIDAPGVADQIASTLRDQVLSQLRRRGAVVAVSGGVDSSVTLALCGRALGGERVLALALPERDSDPESLHLARRVARHLEVECVTEDISPALEALGCYARAEEAIRRLVPEYAPGWRHKLVMPSAATSGGLSTFFLVARSPAGEERRVRLSRREYLQIVAATNMKQRTRKLLEYYHADRLHYAVVGTPNRLEYDQGFFVKGGDGAADLKPLAHLYKTQVYQLGEYLGLPPEVLRRPPTTDTYSLPQTQEELYFPLPYRQMDLCLYGLNHGVPAAQVAEACGLPTEQVERVYADIRAKRRATRYLHAPALLVESVPQV